MSFEYNKVLDRIATAFEEFNETNTVDGELEDIKCCLVKYVELKDKEVKLLEKIAVELGLMNSEKKAKANWLSKGDFKL